MTDNPKVTLSDVIKHYNITLAEACKTNNLTFIKRLVKNGASDFCKGLYDACMICNYDVIAYFIHLCLDNNLFIDKQTCVNNVLWHHHDKRSILKLLNALIDGDVIYTPLHAEHYLNALSPVFQDYCYNYLSQSVYTNNARIEHTKTFILYKQRYIRVLLFESELDEILQENCNSMYDKNILPLISVYIEFGE